MKGERRTYKRVYVEVEEPFGSSMSTLEVSVEGERDEIRRLEKKILKAIGEGPSPEDDDEREEGCPLKIPARGDHPRSGIIFTGRLNFKEDELSPVGKKEETEK